ncbi:MAG: hypothetical protein HUU25_08900 [Candidatus Sumerlaeia bacterium]|nr:hypothetical protein [Candidatus Sumerlaeia bacterium]
MPTETATRPPKTEAIRFTRRDTAPPADKSLHDAAALVRPLTSSTVRRPWEPGRAAIPEPVVHLEPAAFHDLLQTSAEPIVIREQRGWLFPRTHYTTQYQGYYFTTRTADGELRMPPGATVIFAERVEFR